MDKEERIRADQDRCFQEQQFFTLTSVAFSGFFGGLQGRLGIFQTIFSAGLVLLVAIYASWLILERADYHRFLGEPPEMRERQSLSGRIHFVLDEKSSSLYYCILTLGAGIAVVILMLSKLWC